MAKKYLDYSGLSRFLDKIKSWASGKFATKDVATTLKDGLMSSNDKASLNSSVQDLSVNGRVITYTKTDGSTATITTQDTNTTYVAMTADEASSGVGTTGRLITAKVLHDKIQDELPSVMTGATASSSGKSGLVPTPGTGQRTKYLRGDGSWETPTDTTYVNATTSTAGLMSASDKTKFNTMSTWYDGVVGTDSDKVVNKWDEIVDFLDGIPEGDTLDGLIEAVKTQVGDLKADIEDGTVKAKESKTLGHETIGSTTKPIYLTSGVATPCTYTLGTSVPSDAKFTDNNTTYSFAGGTNKFTVTPSGGTAQEVSVTPSITNNVTYSGTLTSGQVAVLDGTTGKIKASGYTIAQSVPSDAVFTDTHHTAKNVVSNSANATANKAATNGNVHINLVENNTCRSGIKIVGSGATTVSSDANGNITILSSDTNTTYVAMTGATSTANGKEGLVPKPLYGSENAFLRGDGTWSYRINEFGYTGNINIGTSFSNDTGWFRIARARNLRITPSVFRVAIYRNYSHAVPEAYVFDVCTSYHTNDPISITQVSGQASTIDGNKLIDKIRVTRDTSSTNSILYFDFHVNISVSGNQFYWYVIGNAFSYTESEVVHNPTITSTTETHEFETVNGFKTNGDIYEGDSTLSSKYILTTKGISTSASSKGVKVTLGGTVGSPTVSVTTTTGGIASNNTGVVSGAAVKEYVDANKGVSTVFKAQTSSSNAENGLVPAPTSANATKFLRGDGSWQTPTNTTYNAGSGLSLSGTSFSLKTGYTTSGKNYAVQLDPSGNPYVNVPWTDTDTNTTYNVVTSSVAGLAPKIGTAAAATIGTQSTEWVLASTSGGTPSWRKLPENAFNNTTYNAREFVGDYTYDLGSFYNYTNGCLIEIGTASIATMVAIHVTGNGSGATKPINSMYQFYDYDASNGIIHAGAICLGAPTGDMVAYRYNNKVYAWIKQQQQYQTLSFRLYTNKSELSPVVTNAAAHTSGISNKITISPSGIYAGVNTTTPDWSNSTDARKGIELLQTVGSAPTSGSAPSNYSIGLRISGYYSFMLAMKAGESSLKYYGSSTKGWETVITDKNIESYKSGDSSKLGGVAAADYAQKSDITSGNVTAAKATTADSANAIGGKGLSDLVQGGGSIKHIKVVTSLPASPSNDTLYLIKQ